MSHLICQALASSCWHQNKYIMSADCCIYHLSLIRTKRVISEYFFVIGLTIENVFKFNSRNISFLQTYLNTHLKLLCPREISATPLLVIWTINIVNFKILWDVWFSFHWGCWRTISPSHIKWKWWWIPVVKVTRLVISTKLCVESRRINPGREWRRCFILKGRRCFMLKGRCQCGSRTLWHLSFFIAWYSLKKFFKVLNLLLQLWPEGMQTQLVISFNIIQNIFQGRTNLQHIQAIVREISKQKQKRILQENIPFLAKHFNLFWTQFWNIVKKIIWNLN